MIRLQGAEYNKMKNKLNTVAYSTTSSGNICIYYEDGYEYCLNDEEKYHFFRMD